MIGRRVIVVWTVLAVLIGAIVALEYRDRRREAGADAEPADRRSLLPVPVERLGAIEIADRGRLHRFERDATKTWFYHGVHSAATADHTHTADPVLSERIDRAFAAFGRTRAERQFALEGDGAAYGVTAPEIVILVYRPNESQPLAQYAVGATAPDTLSRYVSAVGSRTVVTIPRYQIDNLLGLIQAAAAGPSDANVTRRP